MYSGTVADFSATDSLIYRGELRTEQYDYKHLNGECSNIQGAAATRGLSFVDF